MYSNTSVKSITFFFQAEDGIRDGRVTGVQTCALPILLPLFFRWFFRLDSDLRRTCRLFCFEILDTEPEAFLGFRGGHGRSEERRVGKECRYRWSPDQ